MLRYFKMSWLSANGMEWTNILIDHFEKGLLAWSINVLWDKVGWDGPPLVIFFFLYFKF